MLFCGLHVFGYTRHHASAAPRDMLEDGYLPGGANNGGRVVLLDELLIDLLLLASEATGRARPRETEASLFFLFLPRIDVALVNGCSTAQDPCFFARNEPQQRSVYSALATLYLIPLFVDKFGHSLNRRVNKKGTILVGSSILSPLFSILLVIPT